jgi:release factor glutamine methyltransferase
LRISEFLSNGTRTLQQIGIDNPRLEAELLLSKALDIERKRLFLEMSTELTDAELMKARRLLDLRATRFPLQYITEKIEFLGLEFLLEPGVFIPRPETELLVVEARALLSELVSPVILDVGTGSGVIAISLAVGDPRVKIYAVDISPLALEVARFNAERHGVGDRVSFHVGNFFSAIKPEVISGCVDLIVSNPPYVPSSQIPSLAPEISKFEPVEAIDGGQDGLCCVRALLREGPALLKSRGWILLEIGAGQAEATKEIAALAGLVGIRTARDLAGIERVLVMRKM